MLNIAEERPPYIEFFKQPRENRAKTVEAGHIVYDDIDMVSITPAGSRDRIVKEVSNWLEVMEFQAQNDRLPKQWLAEYKRAYKQWKEDGEVSVDGYKLRDWPGITPAQLANLKEVGIITVEQLAQANETALSYLGLGGRALKEKAISFLATSSDVGKVAEENAQLKSKLGELTTTVESQAQKINELSAKLEAVSKKSS